jgi:hypothetical protein
MKDFVFIASAFVLIRIPWLAIIPMHGAPDEFAHIWVIRFIKEHLYLPSYKEVLAGGASAVYGSLPQIGYIPHILFSLPFADFLFAARFASLLMGLVTLWAAFKIGRLLFKQNKFLSLALPILVILHPQFTFLHAYVNNDSTACALSSLIILAILETLQDGITHKRSLYLGILSGLCVLSKYSSLATIPVTILVLIAAFFLHKNKVSIFISNLAIFALSGLAVSSWWFVRNYFEFNHDILGTKTMYKTWAITFNRQLDYYISPMKIIKESRWWRMMFFSFWGVFGYMDRYLPKPIYWTYVAFFATAIIGCLKETIIRFSSKQKIDWIELTQWSSLVLIVIINLMAMIWASTVNLGGPQGRYLLISEIPVLAIIIVGLNKLSKGNNILIGSFILFNCFANIFSWIMLYGIYCKAH